MNEESRTTMAAHGAEVLLVEDTGRAVTMTLRALALNSGTEVIVSCLASNPILEAIARAGRVPVAVDVEPATGQICPCAVRHALTPNTGAVVVGHRDGNPADMRSFLALAHAHGLHLIEDCTDALGAEALGQPVGTFGSAAIHRDPFQAADKSIHSVVLVLRPPATPVTPLASARCPGSPLPYAALETQLVCASYFTGRQRSNAAVFAEHLGHLDEVQLPAAHEDADPSWSRYPLQVADRDGLLRHLKESGINLPFHDASLFGVPISADRFPNASRLARQTLILSTGPDLTEEQLLQICLEIRAYYAAKRMEVIRSRSASETPVEGMRARPRVGELRSMIHARVISHP